jgi:DNA-binding response OmpR family regulator
MKKILIIEDDEIVASIYKTKFVNEGYQVETALDGEQGFALAVKFHPDVIILDLMLPKITGTELMKKLREEKGLEHVPIIVFSNTYLTHMVQEAWKAGATKCISKASCTPRQLIDVIRSVAGGADEGAAPDQSQLTASSAPQPDKARPDGKSEAEFSAELRNKFVQSFPATLKAMRAAHQGLVKAENDGARKKHAGELYRLVHAMTGNAGVSGMAGIAMMADALEALLRELDEKSQNINVSTLRTVASSIDFLLFLFEHAARKGEQYIPSALALVVDDEAISRKAVVQALEKVKIKYNDVEDSSKAYEMLLQNRYDLVFLDVDMPGMNGFELCTKLRALPAYKKIPVIFVTSLTDFESRASSMMSGGNDFIGKPFLLMELAVKALVYVLRARLNPQKS